MRELNEDRPPRFLFDQHPYHIPGSESPFQSVSLSRQRTRYTAQAELACSAGSTAGPSRCTPTHTRQPAERPRPADILGGTLRVPSTLTK
mmetsp:Transcript_26620/g.36614  ORF Transcript_26620/g.36614 Transcript_26620/m.36614 type:complete len:90 (-) Transcript_26620:1183-1452(-)